MNDFCTRNGHSALRAPIGRGFMQCPVCMAVVDSTGSYNPWVKYDEKKAKEMAEDNANSQQQSAPPTPGRP